MASNSFSLSSSATSLFSTPSSSRDDSKTQEYPPESDDFRRLLIQLSDELDDEDNRLKIRFFCKRKLGRGKDKMNTLQMLERLEEKGEFSAYNLKPLEELLRLSVERHDLIDDYVKPYRMKLTSQLTQAEDGECAINIG